MSSGLVSEESINRFFRSLKRACDPVDVATPRRLWSIRMFAFLGLFATWMYSRDVPWPVTEMFFFGSLVILSLCGELKKLWDRVEQLESGVMLRDQGSRKRPDGSDPKD
jgi:hypothetical protein